MPFFDVYLFLPASRLLELFHRSFDPFFKTQRARGHNINNTHTHNRYGCCDGTKVEGQVWTEDETEDMILLLTEGTKRIGGSGLFIRKSLLSFLVFGIIKDESDRNSKREQRGEQG